MKLRLFLFYFGNIVDIISTLHVVNTGGIEINPISKWLLKRPLVFVLTKLIIATIMVNMVWSLRSYELSNICSWALFIGYACITIYYAMLFLFLT